MAAARSAPPQPGTPEPLSIGELAERTGVATTALRYYDELGLVRPAARVSGRRRYAASAVAEVGAIVFLREVGFSLAEIGSVMAADERQAWRQVVDRKLVELADQQHRLDAARTALEHARRCPAGQPISCPRFWAIIDAQQEASRSRAATHERTDALLARASGTGLRWRSSARRLLGP